MQRHNVGVSWAVFFVDAVLFAWAALPPGSREDQRGVGLRGRSGAEKAVFRP